MISREQILAWLKEKDTCYSLYKKDGKTFCSFQMNADIHFCMDDVMPLFNNMEEFEFFNAIEFGRLIACKNNKHLENFQNQE